MSAPNLAETSGVGAASDFRPIVVGVSLESGSRTALQWAWHEALLHQAPLTAVTAWRPALANAAARPTAFPPLLPEELRVRTEQHLERIVRDTLGVSDRITIQTIRGSVPRALLAAAVGAQLLVVGPPHPSRAGALLGGGRELQLAARVDCPVVVMPHRLTAASDRA